MGALRLHAEDIREDLKTLIESKYTQQQDTLAKFQESSRQVQDSVTKQQNDQHAAISTIHDTLNQQKRAMAILLLKIEEFQGTMKRSNNVGGDQTKIKALENENAGQMEEIQLLKAKNVALEEMANGFKKKIAEQEGEVKKKISELQKLITG
jgi:hypothetical protein